MREPAAQFVPLTSRRRRQVIVCLLSTVAALSTGCGVMDWSPDGTKLVTTWPGVGNRSLLRVVDVQTGLSRVLPGTDHASNPRWSPDGRWIAYQREVGDSTIPHVYDLHTSKATALGAKSCSAFVWREDSARLLVCTSDSALCYAMPGAVPTWEAKLPEQARPVIYGAWIRDTDAVVLEAAKDLWIIEGAEVTRITTTGDVLGFGLRDGGRELIWARASRNPRYILLTLYAMSVNKRSARRLPLPYRVAEINPTPQAPVTSVAPVAFSPDGKHMAVACWYEAPHRHKKNVTGTVFVMDTDGNHARRPYPDSLGQLLLPPGSTSFSPDGRRLCLLVGSRKTAHVWICKADGTGGRSILTGPVPPSLRP